MANTILSPLPHLIDGAPHTFQTLTQRRRVNYLYRQMGTVFYIIVAT